MIQVFKGIDFYYNNNIELTSIRADYIMHKFDNKIEAGPHNPRFFLPSYALLEKQDSSYTQILRNPQSLYQGTYLSPQLLNSLKRNLLFPVHINQKSILFSLGMIFLEVALLETSADLYDLKNFEIVDFILEAKLQSVANRYSNSSPIFNIINLLLQKNEEERPKIQDILNLVQDSQKQFKINSLPLSQYQSTRSDEKLKFSPSQNKIESTLIKLSQLKQTNQELQKSIINNIVIENQEPNKQQFSTVQKNNESKKIFDNPPTQQINIESLNSYLKKYCIIENNQNESEFNNQKEYKSLENFYSNSKLLEQKQQQKNQEIQDQNQQTNNLQNQIVTQQKLINIQQNQQQNLQMQPNYTIEDTFDQQHCKQLNEVLEMEQMKQYNKNELSRQNLIQSLEQQRKSPIKINELNINQHLANSKEKIIQNSQQVSQNNIEREFVVETFQNGSVYQGQKLFGKRDGVGKFYYFDGGLYDGDWVNNQMEGLQHYKKIFINYLVMEYCIILEVKLLTKASGKLICFKVKVFQIMKILLSQSKILIIKI